MDKELVLVGDRVLILPALEEDRTDTGLYLPEGIKERDKVQSGTVIKVGPGYPIPSVNDTDEPWKNRPDEPKYVPLQPKEGDQAVYLQNSAIEIEFNKEKYIVVPHSAILLLLRDDGLFE